MSEEEDDVDRPRDTADEIGDMVRLGEVAGYAELGDLLQLANHLEDGGEVSPEIRDFLVRHLRGEIKKKPGIKRTKANDDRERDIAAQVWMRMRLDGISKYQATKRALEANPDLNAETLKSYLKKWGVKGKTSQNQ